MPFLLSWFTIINNVKQLLVHICIKYNMLDTRAVITIGTKTTILDTFIVLAALQLSQQANNKHCFDSRETFELRI